MDPTIPIFIIKSNYVKKTLISKEFSFNFSIECVIYVIQRYQVEE